MKTIGIIGGLSPESTLSYYKGLNDGVRVHLGGHNGAKILLSSLNFQVFCDLKAKEDWDSQAMILTQEAVRLEQAGADFILLATNTMHKMADQIEAALTIPFLHIGDATAAKIKAQGLENIGLLATRYTMELDFYKGRLEDAGIRTVIPDEQSREDVNRIIYDELCKGAITPESKVIYQNVIGELKDQGAQGVIFGCTEIGLLLDQADVDIPVFDTAQIHIEAALDMALED